MRQPAKLFIVGSIPTGCSKFSCCNVRIKYGILDERGYSSEGERFAGSDQVGISKFPSSTSLFYAASVGCWSPHLIFNQTTRVRFPYAVPILRCSARNGFHECGHNQKTPDEHVINMPCNSRDSPTPIGRAFMERVEDFGQSTTLQVVKWQRRRHDTSTKWRCSITAVQRIVYPQSASSTLVISASFEIKWGCSSIGRARHCHCRGSGIETRHPRHLSLRRSSKMRC